MRYWFIHDYAGEFSIRLLCRVMRAYKVTTNPRPGAEVAPNLLNQNFTPPGPDQVWVSDITYLRTGEGWLYVAAIMDLYSRRIVGWHVDKRMTSSLVCRALMKAYNLRNPPRGLVVHTDRGSQYTGGCFQSMLKCYGLRSSMGDVGPAGILILIYFQILDRTDPCWDWLKCLCVDLSSYSGISRT